MSDRTLGAACMVVAAGMAWAAHDYAAPISYEPVGPRAFPLMLAGLLGLCGVWMLLRPAPGASPFHGLNWRPVAWVMASLLGYALVFQWLGFTVATALMSVPVGLAFGGSWKQSLAGGLGLGLGLYLLFDKLLDVVLPTGLLSTFLGGH